MGPHMKPKHIYTDSSPELIKAMHDLGWSGIHDISLPYRPQTNEVAERAGRRVKEGTSTSLIQTGSHGPWWAEAQRHFCFMYNART
eukprot:9968544-Karenia_brevis.AAC.1